MDALAPLGRELFTFGLTDKADVYARNIHRCLLYTSYMTTTLSQFCATTPRSWVMKSTDMFSFFFICLLYTSRCV